MQIVMHAFLVSIRESLSKDPTPDTVQQGMQASTEPSSAAVHDCFDGTQMIGRHAYCTVYLDGDRLAIRKLPEPEPWTALPDLPLACSWTPQLHLSLMYERLTSLHQAADRPAGTRPVKAATPAAGRRTITLHLAYSDDYKLRQVYS